MCSVIVELFRGAVHVLDEIVLPHSYTSAACEVFLRRIETWVLYTGQELQVYGDATGERRQSSGSQTDWQIVRACLAKLAGRFKISYRYTHSNPLIKDRVNCLNAALRNQAGEHRLLIDSRCRELVRDFEEVSWRLDAHGNSLPDLDKSDPKRTHLSDALGYMTACQFPMRDAGRFRSERIY